MDAAFNTMAAGDYESYDPPSSRFEEINAMIDLVRKSQDDYRDLTTVLSTITKEIGSAVQGGCSQGEIKALHERLIQAINQVQLPEST